MIEERDCVAGWGGVEKVEGGDSVAGGGGHGHSQR